MRVFITLILSLFLITMANAGDLTLTSTGFSNNDIIPPLYGCNGSNLSPDLSWINVPANTKSFALILTSPDWSAGFAYLWILYNIPESTRKLDKGANNNLPNGILVGTNWYEEMSYRGPCPPDNLLHHYVFTLYALDAGLDLEEGAYGDDVMAQIKKHILKQAQLIGVYSH